MRKQVQDGKIFALGHPAILLSPGPCLFFYASSPLHLLFFPPGLLFPKISKWHPLFLHSGLPWLDITSLCSLTLSCVSSQHSSSLTQFVYFVYHFPRPKHRLFEGRDFVLSTVVPSAPRIVLGKQQISLMPYSVNKLTVSTTNSWVTAFVFKGTRIQWERLVWRHASRVGQML